MRPGSDATAGVCPLMAACTARESIAFAIPPNFTGRPGIAGNHPGGGEAP